MQKLFISPSTPKKRVSNKLDSQKAKTDIVFPVEATPKRILLVEDNYLNRQMLEDYLVFCDYELFSLGSGIGLFEALADFQPHLILLDLKLPDIDGYTLLEQIQQNRDYKNIPIIVVSAFAFKSDRQRALNLGARRYFVKPVNLANLKQSIQDELQECRV